LNYNSCLAIILSFARFCPYIVASEVGENDGGEKKDWFLDKGGGKSALEIKVKYARGCNGNDVKAIRIERRVH